MSASRRTSSYVNVRLLLNVELRNYVISRQIVERRVTSDRLLFKYCGIIVLLVNIPITICITVIPPLPSPSPGGMSIKQRENAARGKLLMEEIECCVVRLEDVSESDRECGQKCGQASSVVWDRALCNNERPGTTTRNK